MTLPADRTVLAIETSCDETCAAVVRGRDVLANVVASQAELHDRFGGVVPEVASRRHLELIDDVVDEALAAAAGASIEAVAVTQGPGLIGALLVGLASAKARAWAWELPLVPVDHLLGHVASSLLTGRQLEPPFLCLLASGGHTLMLDVDHGLRVRLLGSTRDDAAGEAFDKGARLLGLGMPGGPALERLAADGDPDAVPITPAMRRHASLDTSFAGIKTALAVALQESTQARREDVAASYQRAIVETLATQAERTLARRGQRAEAHPRVPRRDVLAVVGGVSANRALRARLEQMTERHDVDLVTVPLRFCSDNAAMVGVASAWCDPAAACDSLTIDAYATSPLFRTGELVPTKRT